MSGNLGETGIGGAIWLDQPGSSLTINGNLHADLQGDVLQGLFVKNDASLTINGNVDLLLNGVPGQEKTTSGIVLIADEDSKDQPVLNIKGDHFKAITNDNRNISLYLNKANAVIEAGDIYFENNVTATPKKGTTQAEENIYNDGPTVIDGSLTLNGNKTSIVLNANGSKADQRGIYVKSNPDGQSFVNVNGGENISTGFVSFGKDGELNIASKAVNIDITDKLAYGISASDGSAINFTDPEAQINITVHGKTGAVGLFNSVNKVQDNQIGQFGSINVEGNLTIFAETEGLTEKDKDHSMVYGIYSNSYEEKLSNNENNGIFLNGFTSVNVHAKGEKGWAVGVHSDNKVAEGSEASNAKITIHHLVVTAIGQNGAKSDGINAVDNGHIVLTGDAVVGAYGDDAYGMALLNGNITIGGTALVYGDTGGVYADQESKIALGQGAILSTNSMDSQGQTTLAQAATLEVWGAEGITSNLGHIEANQGTVSVGAGSYSISTFSGDDNSLVLSDLANTKSVGIDTKTGPLNIVANGTSNDQYANAQEAADALLDAVHIQNDQAKDQNKVEVQVGDVNDGLSATLTEDGKLDNVSLTKNDKLDAFGSVTALSALTLRHEMNSLSKRMGELRDAPAGVGAWVRGYGSEMEYGAQNVTTKNNSIQVGSDYTVGDWKVGAAFTYTDGESSYDNGSADNKGYGVAVYGTWFVPCGAYVDLMAKYNRLDNDFALNGMDGSYDANAYGMSAETGYRFNFMDGGVYVEPQVGIAYSRMTGESFMASNGVTIEQDDYDSLIGRVGVRTGFKFPKDKGTIYARVSGVYDFQGEVNGKATKGKAVNTIEEDLGGAWLEVGIGANFNWTKNTYTYIDFERTNGGEVKENYRWNIGVRHNF